jgi:hypothetical protein
MGVVAGMDVSLYVNLPSSVTGDIHGMEAESRG